jgi:hypothetical protein
MTRNVPSRREGVDAADPLDRDATALDQLEYEDLAIAHILDEFDTQRDRLRHGMLGRLFVDHLAVRQAARETVAAALARLPTASDLGERLVIGMHERRRELASLDELTRGVQPMNLNQGQDFDGAMAPIAQAVRDEIETDVHDVIPAVRTRVPADQLHDVLPSARHVRRHAPSHPHASGRRLHERFAPLVRLHALYDRLRDMPRITQRPREEAEINAMVRAEQQHPDEGTRRRS